MGYAVTFLLNSHSDAEGKPNHIASEHNNVVVNDKAQRFKPHIRFRSTN